jgi:maleylpyruvate isomerase
VTAPLVFYDYWRSGAGYRTRIALNLKGVAYERRTIDLRTGAQRGDAYKAIAPQGLLPALVTPDGTLTQSLAILEWLEETYPTPALLPAGAGDRAVVRAMSLLIAADTHPLGNLRILQALRSDYGASEPQVAAWVGRWIGDGFAALEKLIERHGGGFAFGATPTFADCCLAPQVYHAERFGVDLTPYPRIRAAYDTAAKLDAFAAAYPSKQSDAD